MALSFAAIRCYRFTLFAKTPFAAFRPQTVGKHAATESSFSTKGPWRGFEAPFASTGNLCVDLRLRYDRFAFRGDLSKSLVKFPYQQGFERPYQLLGLARFHVAWRASC